MKKLYMISATDGKTITQLYPFYAKTLEEARDEGFAWRDKEHPHLQQLKVRGYPGGFQLVMDRLPGVIEEVETEEHTGYAEAHYQG